MKIKKKIEYSVDSENYLDSNTNRLKLRYFIKIVVKKKFLWWFIKKTYKLRNIRFFENFGMKKEFLVDFVIFFATEKSAELFMNNNINDFTENGLYTGGLSTTSLNVMYDNKTYQKKSDESVEEFYKSLDFTKK